MELRTRSDFGACLSARGPLGAAAEVGVAEGRYALEMLSGWGVPKLYLVDLWAFVPDLADAPNELRLPAEHHEENYRGCMERIAPYRDRVVILRGWSWEVAEQIPDGSLQFVHLDAGHDRESVDRDLWAYWPKLEPGGIMSGHDYMNLAYGVHEAVDVFCDQLGLRVHGLDLQRPNDACFWFEKPPC